MRLSDHGHCNFASSPSQRKREGGREEKKVMPGLGWRSRGQRFLPACRTEKTYVFLRYDRRIRSPSLRLFANRSGPIAKGGTRTTTTTTTTAAVAVATTSPLKAGRSHVFKNSLQPTCGHSFDALRGDIPSC